MPEDAYCEEDGMRHIFFFPRSKHKYTEGGSSAAGRLIGKTTHHAQAADLASNLALSAAILSDAEGPVVLLHLAAMLATASSVAVSSFSARLLLASFAARRRAAAVQWTGRAVLR